MKELIDWLNDPKDYYRGIHLYEVHGGYQSLVTLLTNHHDPEKLESAMRKLKATLAEKAASLPPATPAHAHARNNTYLRELDAKWHPLFSEMSMCHARLSTVRGDKERKKLATRIISLEAQCATYWQQRDHYEQTGKILDIAPVSRKKKVTRAPQLPANEHRRLTTLRSNLCHNRNELAAIEERIQAVKDGIEKSKWEGRKTKKLAQIKEKEAAIKKLEE
ncbi:MAG: hypothetical protein JSS76_08470 [Bacteroidetes bacterium]|nr:hypothetical protein [Bacteroidota bacterium]